MWKVSKVTCKRKSCGVPVATGKNDFGTQSASEVDEMDQFCTRASFMNVILILTDSVVVAGGRPLRCHRTRG